MQADLFKCSFCSESYDLELHIPKLLLPCLHCLCLQCLKNIFINHSPQERQCPSCNISFILAIPIPEAFPTNPTLLQLLQNRPKTKFGEDCIEIDSQRASSAKERNDHEEPFQDYVRKKQKTEQEIDDELEKLQEVITSQFIGMRKMLHISQNIDRQNKNLLAEATNNLKDVFIGTAEVLDKILKTTTSQTNEVLTQEERRPFQQIPQENNLSSENDDEKAKIKIEASSALKTNSTDDEDCFMLNPEMTNKVTEMDQEEQLQSQNQLREKEIQEMKSQIMEMESESHLKLDFSDKEISERTFTNICSEEFWKGIERNKVSSLEVNFSATSVSDKQFTMFVLDTVNKIENLAFLMINIAETNISNESLKVLSDQCIKNHKLKGFKLNCSQTSIGDECFKRLSEGLSSSVQTLEKIELVFDSTDVQGEEFLDALFGMNQLKHLKLSFEDSHLSSKTISSVVSCLGFLAKSLESLDLNFNGTGIDDKSLGSFSNHAIFHMEKLKHLKLSLGETFISNDFLSDFFENLSALATHLKTLELDLHSTELDNTAFKQFCDEVLSQMQNTENLKLNLRQTKITDTSLKNFILPVHRLKSLSLNISENNIHDTDLQIFKENNNFKSFKSIDFQVGQTEVSDEAFQDFLTFLEKGYDTKVFSCLNETSPEYSSDAENHLNQELKPKNQIKTSKESIMSKLEMERKVYAELKKELVLYDGLKPDPSTQDTIYISNLVDQLEPRVYDSILKKILKRVLSISKVEALKIEEWKKIIRTMIISKLNIYSQRSKKKTRKTHNQNFSRTKPNNYITEEKQKNSSPERKQSRSSSRRKEKHHNSGRKQKNYNLDADLSEEI